MTHSTLVQDARNDGVIISLTTAGKLKISGGEEMVKKWMPAIAEKKAEIIAFLANTAEPSGDSVTAWKWRVTFPDGRVVFSHNIPFASREDILRIYPSAVLVEVADGDVSKIETNRKEK